MKVLLRVQRANAVSGRSVPVPSGIGRSRLRVWCGDCRTVHRAGRRCGCPPTEPIVVTIGEDGTTSYTYRRR